MQGKQAYRKNISAGLAGWASVPSVPWNPKAIQTSDRRNPTPLTPRGNAEVKGASNNGWASGHMEGIRDCFRLVGLKKHELDRVS